MKKIIAAFVLFSGIFTMSAQEVTPLATIQANVNELREYAYADATFVNDKLELNDENYEDLVQIFYNKYKLLLNDNSQESITEISSMVMNRLQSAIPNEKYSQLANLEGAIEKLSGLVYLNGH